MIIISYVRCLVKYGGLSPQTPASIRSPVVYMPQMSLAPLATNVAQLG